MFRGNRGWTTAIRRTRVYASYACESHPLSRARFDFSSLSATFDILRRECCEVPEEIFVCSSVFQSDYVILSNKRNLKRRCGNLCFELFLACSESCRRLRLQRKPRTIKNDKRESFPKPKRRGDCSTSDLERGKENVPRCRCNRTRNSV